MGAAMSGLPFLPVSRSHRPRTLASEILTARLATWVHSHGELCHGQRTVTYQ